MPFGLSPVHLVVVLIVVLIFIGPRRLPALGSSAGRWLRDMRSGVLETKDSFVAEVAKPTGTAAAATTPFDEAIPASGEKDPLTQS